MSRVGMASLISRLRALCEAGTNDHTTEGISYWSNDQLQAMLDRHSTTLMGLRLTPLFGGGTVYQYLIPIGRDFEEAGTDSGFALRGADGALIGPEQYSVNYAARRITFNTDQGGAPMFLDVRTYNLNAAAAEVWAHKAAFAAAKLDWAADGHRVRASQEYRHCVWMARRFRSMAGIQVGRLVREG